MPLSSCTRLGAYEIVSFIGAGGMGEVYRARDTRLNRIVAIKTLLEPLSNSPQLRERFDREEHAIASLSHPHICALYDIGTHNGIHFLVMEYLEGEILAQRIKKGPLPISQALQYAIQIADALDEAHRHGIIHRDLKPANIMLTSAGAKLLDFGLAKMTDTPGEANFASGLASTRPLTAQGSIVGTFQYMAPEQLEGKNVDSRTDIFAFGAVLYEMATGRMAFEGKSHAGLIAAILEHDPPLISAVRQTAPPTLDHVVKKALAKDPVERWQTARDLKDELKWIVAENSRAASVAAPLKRNRSRKWMIGVLAAAALLAALLVGFKYLSLSERREEIVRFSIPFPAEAMFTTTETAGPTPQLAVSPDGRMVVFAASRAAGRSSLWMRAFDSFTSQMLPGTEGASFPFWSPDSRFVGFFADGKLKKVDLSGGAPQAITDAPAGRGGT